MTRFPKWLIPAFLTGTLALAGCEKQPAGYDPNPNRPAGVKTTAAMLVASLVCAGYAHRGVEKAGRQRLRLMFGA